MVSVCFLSPLLQVNMTDLQETISGYISCMIMPVPGFSCPLSAAIMSPDYSFNTATGVRSYAPKHYIGVMQYLPGLQLPLAKGNMARFLWNVMAFDASDGTVGARCDPFQNVCPAGQVSNRLVASVLNKASSCSLQNSLLTMHRRLWHSQCCWVMLRGTAYLSTHCSSTLQAG